MSKLKTLLFALLFVSSLSQATSLKLGSPYFPPYVYFDIDGELTGTWMTQLSPVLKNAGLSFSAVHVPIKRFYSSAATGKIDLFAMPKGLPGMENVLFSARPFSHFDLRVFWLDSADGVATLSELAGRKVALIKGYSYGGKLSTEIDSQQRSQFVVADDQRQALRMLMNGDVNYVLGYWAIMTHLQKAFPNQQVNNAKISELPIYFAIHQNAENAQKLMQQFDAAMEN